MPRVSSTTKIRPVISCLVVALAELPEERFSNWVFGAISFCPFNSPVGSIKIKVLPSFNLLLAVKLPPSISAIRRLM